MLNPVLYSSGYLPSSSVFFACLWTETELRSISTQKKQKQKQERGQYPAILTEQAWPIKDYFIIWKKNTVFLRDTAGNPGRAR